MLQGIYINTIENGTSHTVIPVLDPYHFAPPHSSPPSMWPSPGHIYVLQEEKKGSNLRLKLPLLCKFQFIILRSVFFIVFVIRDLRYRYIVKCLPIQMVKVGPVSKRLYLLLPDQLHSLNGCLYSLLSPHTDKSLYSSTIFAQKNIPVLLNT
jgi:hypothetical protein